jgi:predicted branched-subunit amino acid permease
VQLPKPLYEALPYFLVAMGILFITLVMKRYEYAPTLFIWLLGLFCVIAGAVLFSVRLIFRMQHAREKITIDVEDDD